MWIMRGDSLSVMARTLGIAVRSARMADRNAALEQEGADLVDHTGALAN